MTSRILIVDDDPAVLRYVERTLSRAGYALVTAGSVAEAVRHASSMQIHAALVDHGLGKETGLEVLAQLRRTQPSCLRILMTASEDFPMVVEAVNKGEVLRVIRKPFTSGSLRHTLEEAFDSSRRMALVAASQLKAVHQREGRMLQKCFEDDLLALAVQPIVRVVDGQPKPIAYECLLRSRHPVLNSPLSVLKAAEVHNRIADIGSAVFRLAAGWLPRIPADARLFINLHPTQLGDFDRLQQDIGPLLPHANRVVLEMTERSRLQDIDDWEQTLDWLMTSGFLIAVDDLGAGYNSLNMLADLQPAFIKLDMSLVRNISTDFRKQRLVQLINTFAEATHADVIGEGVEDEEEAEALHRCGVFLLQGYHFAKPQVDYAPLALVSGGTGPR